MTFLTIFTAPKPFVNPHITTIQCNAIQSWLHLGEEVDVLLMGNETGMAEVASELGVRHLDDVRCNDKGPPFLNSMFSRAREVSDGPLLMCTNADILFLPDIVAAARQVAAQTERFLMFGQRWDLEVREALDFSNGWDQRLLEMIQRRGRLHPALGSDYFIFPRGCFTEIPDFTIGRSGWDNWMIYYARQQGIPAVDATPSTKVVHQNHDYSHLPGGIPPYHLEESEINRELAGGKSHLYLILDCDKQLVNGKLRSPRLTMERFIRRIELGFYPKNGDPHGARRFIIRRLRRLRRGIDPSRN
jgi:hypothetical protein